MLDVMGCSKRKTKKASNNSKGFVSRLVEGLLGIMDGSYNGKGESSYGVKSTSEQFNKCGSEELDSNGFKYLELLRYYINRDLMAINKSIVSRTYELASYFIASLVDVLIVALYGSVLSDQCYWVQIAAVFGLIFLFLVVTCCTKTVLRFWRSLRKELGKRSSEAKQAIIDEFDNMACDALLICDSYRKRYWQEKEPYIREFLLYEVIHHFTKSTKSFGVIIDGGQTYISDTNPELIDTYRIDNYIVFAKEIYKFVAEATKNSNATAVTNVVKGIETSIDGWSKKREALDVKATEEKQEKKIKLAMWINRIKHRNEWSEKVKK